MRTPLNYVLYRQARQAFAKKIDKFVTKAGLIFAFAVFVMPLQTSALSAPLPRLKPEPPALSTHVNDSDARVLRRALNAAKRGNWQEVARLEKTIKDPVVRDIVLWVRATRDRQAPQSVLTKAAHDLSDWPRQTTIRAKAEAKLFDKPLKPRASIAWFKGESPVSGEGRAVLARANYALGNKELGDKWLRYAWHESKLTRDRQKRIFAEFKSKLTKEDHARRADHLIWSGRSHFSKAQALLPHMGADERKLMDARLRIAANRPGMDNAIKAVPAKYKKDTGLLFERAKWRRKKRTKEAALPLYLEIQGAPINDVGKSAVWREKRLLAYWLISEKNYKDAYALTLNHGLSKGAGFAQAEFLGGWLALRKLNQPETAQQHFTRLANGVSTPVSLARGHYWLARSQSGLESVNSYTAAAEYPNTFYGQLAITKISNGQPMLFLPPEVPSETSLAQLKSDRRVKAMQILAELDEERFYSQFSFHLDDVVPTPMDLSALATLSKDFGYMRPSVRAAKQVSRFQSMLTESGYPIVQVVENLPSEFEKEFVYAIARQETEFETNAISSAKAYGLMQMINSTAKYTARKHRIPYNQSRLLSDADYAARLGSHHLNDLLKRWDGSYILAAVSYNAGPHRAKKWIEAYGDPRSPNVDPIDWIESTPFSETRNYVQRVIENMQVYRARRNGDIHPLLIERDIQTGQP